MSLAIPDELIVEGVARAFAARIEADPELAERLLTRMAELHCELLTPAEAAQMLGLKSVKNLRERWRDYGLDKSTALGPNEPRFFRSQVIGAMKREGVLLHGRTPREETTRAGLAARITPFPKRLAPTLAAAHTG